MDTTGDLGATESQKRHWEEQTQRLAARLEHLKERLGLDVDDPSLAPDTRAALRLAAMALADMDNRMLDLWNVITLLNNNTLQMGTILNRRLFWISVWLLGLLAVVTVRLLR